MKNFKGISPLIASVVLIGFTIAISMLVMGWFSTTTRVTTSTITNKTDFDVSCINAAVSIEDVYIIDGLNRPARAVIKNTGGTDVTIQSAQLYDKLGGNISTSTSLPVVLSKGGILNIAFQYTGMSNKVMDLSPSPKNNGTCNTNPCNYTLSGKYESAVQLDGNDVISINTNMSVYANLTNNRSMCGWAKTIDLGSSFNPPIVAYGYNQIGAAMIIARQGGSATLLGDGFSDAISKSNFWTVDVWHHVCLTYNGSTAKLYGDGILVASGDKTWSLNTAAGTANIGNGVDGGTGYWNGTIDDVAIWSRELTGEEVNISMSGDIQKTLSNGLVGYWNFNEARGVISCPTDFSKFIVTTTCGGVSDIFSKTPKCVL